MEKRNKIIYYIFTGLLSALVLMSAGMYIFNHEEIATTFLDLGHPVHVIYPLAIAKILAIVAIWTNKSRVLTEWAYAGLFFDFVLAFMAHFYAGDGDSMGAIIATALLIGSYVMRKKVNL